jgi:hypothetical protein
MIPYDHIPPHLRLSDRYLIVEDYPGGAEWWNVQQGRRDKPTRRVRDDEQRRRNAELAAKYRRAKRLRASDEVVA